MDLTGTWYKIETSVESLAPLIHQVTVCSSEDYPEKAERIRKASKEIVQLCQMAKELSKRASSRLEPTQPMDGDVTGQVDLTQDDTVDAPMGDVNDKVEDRILRALDEVFPDGLTIREIVAKVDANLATVEAHLNKRLIPNELCVKYITDNEPTFMSASQRLHNMGQPMSSLSSSMLPIPAPTQYVPQQQHQPSLYPNSLNCTSRIVGVSQPMPYPSYPVYASMQAPTPTYGYHQPPQYVPPGSMVLASAFPQTSYSSPANVQPQMVSIGQVYAPPMGRTIVPAKQGKRYMLPLKKKVDDTTTKAPPIVHNPIEESPAENGGNSANVWNYLLQETRNIRSQGNVIHEVMAAPLTSKDKWPPVSTSMKMFAPKRTVQPPVSNAHASPVMSLVSKAPPPKWS